MDKKHTEITNIWLKKLSETNTLINSEVNNIKDVIMSYKDEIFDILVLSLCEDITDEVLSLLKECYKLGAFGELYAAGIKNGYDIENLAEESVNEKIDGMTTEDRIRSYVTDYYVDVDIGLDIDIASERLIFNIQRIADTESHRCFCCGKQKIGELLAEDDHIVYKTWDATMDRKTRATHFALNGTTIEIGEKFKTINGEATAPGLFGVAEEDINCRCIITLSIDGTKNNGHDSYDEWLNI